MDKVVLLPSDHYISNEENYINTINKALNYVDEYGICTIGIASIGFTHKEYGYIRARSLVTENIYHTDYFIEKPDVVQARNYIENNGYFWNSRIFYL